MTIKTKITFREYLNLMYSLTYRKGVTIFLTVVGLVMLLFAALDFFGVLNTGTSPLSRIMFGVFLFVFIPLMVYISAKRNYFSDKRIQENIEYEFTTQMMRVKGESFNSEINWSKTFKIEELKKCFLIYQSKQVAHLIPKSNLTREQINYLRLLFRGLESIKVKLRR